jgi:hypothetical protein
MPFRQTLRGKWSVAMSVEALEFTAAERLDPREEHIRISSPQSGLLLFLRYLPPTVGTGTERRALLYVHGGTFPSALSIAHRFDGRSWRDALCAAGFHVWGLDFHGFGRLSDPWPEMESAPEAVPPSAAPRTRAASSSVRFVSSVPVMV